MVECDPKRQLKDLDIVMGRSSTGSEVVMMDDRVLETAARAAIPPVHNLNVTKSSRVHIGPKFVSVTQNVDNTEVVKDLPLPHYLWNIAKSTTKAERLSCAAAITFLFACIILIVYFIIIAKNKNEVTDEGAPHDWFITRKMWLAPNFNTTERMTEFEPLRLVIIAHTVSPECDRFINCAAEMRNLQSWYEREYHYDIPHNFMIGNDGRVYEARGWNVVGAHTISYNHCALSIGFIGDYREGRPSFSKVNELQLQRVKMLFEQGIELGHLHKGFQVLGTRDLKATASPGENLYNVIRQWGNYAHNNVFRDRSCTEIRSIFEDHENATTVTPQDEDLTSFTLQEGNNTTITPPQDAE